MLLLPLPVLLLLLVVLLYTLQQVSAAEVAEPGLAFEGLQVQAAHVKLPPALLYAQQQRQGQGRGKWRWSQVQAAQLKLPQQGKMLQATRHLGTAAEAAASPRNTRARS